MRVSATPYSTDWLAISARWVFLVACALFLWPDAALDLQTLPVAAILAWNLLMTTLAGLNVRLPFHRHINVAADVCMAAVLFWTLGGPPGSALWAAGLPILTSAVYFDLLGALAVAAVLALVGLLSQWPFLSTRPWLAFLWIALVLGVGLALGGLASLFVRGLRSRRSAGIAADQARQRAENERMRAIYDLTSTLTATLSYKRVLDAALDLSYSAVNPQSRSSESDPMVGAVLLFHGDNLHVGASRRFTAADARTTFAAAEGLLKRAFETGEAVQSQDVRRDPELSRVIALRACRAGYCFPLRSGFHVYGALLFAHPQPLYFTPIRRDVLDIIGRHAAIAIQNARLYQELLEEKERMVEVHEEARKKLARDLHDGPTQSVAAMAMRLSMVRRMLEEDPRAAPAELARIEDLAQRAGKEIRHTLFTLRPLILESQGLAAAVRSIADKMRDTFEQNVVVELDEQVTHQLEAGKQGLLFYIIEEALNNARKHANAPNIWVRLQPHASGIAVLEVEDDGAGFDVAAVNNTYERRSSLGLMNLRERAELVNGVLDIRSTLGRGTKVSVYIPLTREAAERLQHARAEGRNGLPGAPLAWPGGA